LQELSVREGDPVQAGQVVARIDPSEFQARVRQAQQQADAAKAQVDIAQRQFDNNQALVNQGFISQTALLASQASLNGARATHMAALAALGLWPTSLWADATLRSPSVGPVVAQRLAQPGERVAIEAPMWFTRVSIGNPVMAVMVMLAFVVLGLFAVQRLKVDQFPNIEFPVVVVTTEYPGASPEIVELEVTRKVEEAVNTVAGINQIFSRSYEGSSVVIVQFNLEMDGRRPPRTSAKSSHWCARCCATEIKEPRVQRFDPASRPIWTVALTATDGKRTPVELSSFADQVIKRRLENVRGVGSVTLVGARKREINVYLKPAAMDAYGVAVDQVLQALRTENQRPPCRRLALA
jgi:hypothetical protein